MPEPDVLMQLEIKTLGSLAAQEVALCWGLKDHERIKEEIRVYKNLKFMLLLYDY